jgi:hypothetical protein
MASENVKLWWPSVRILMQLRDDESVDHTGIPVTMIRSAMRDRFSSGRTMRSAYRGLVLSLKRLGIGHVDQSGYLVITDWGPIEEAFSHAAKTS